MALFVYAVEITFQLKRRSQRLVISKTLKLTGGTHDNSRSKRYIDEAAPGCFFKFCIRVHSAIYLTVHANSANSLALS